MAASDSQTAATADRTLLITRVFDAPRSLVFKAWSEPERAMRWFGPKDFTTLEFEMDPRPGGAWHGRMRSPEGQEYANHGVVREVVEPERLVFTFTWDDQPDNEMLVTITFADRDSKTEMVFRQEGLPSVESRDDHSEGWNESFDRLAAYVEASA